MIGTRMTQGNDNDNDGKKQTRITKLGFHSHHQLHHKWNMKLDKINFISNISPS